MAQKFLMLFLTSDVSCDTHCSSVDLRLHHWSILILRRIVLSISSLRLKSYWVIRRMKSLNSVVTRVMIVESFAYQLFSKFLSFCVLWRRWWWSVDISLYSSSSSESSTFVRYCQCSVDDQLNHESHRSELSRSSARLSIHWTSNRNHPSRWK